MVRLFRRRLCPDKSKKHLWRAEEDELLASAVRKRGAGSWNLVCTLVPGRSAKQCRERWHNHLDPNVCKRAWTDHEDKVLLRYRRQLGTSWSRIASHLPGRTDNACKNRWNYIVRHRGWDVYFDDGEDPSSPCQSSTSADCSSASSDGEVDETTELMASSPPPDDTPLSRGLVELGNMLSHRPDFVDRALRTLGLRAMEQGCPPPHVVDVSGATSNLAPDHALPILALCDDYLSLLVPPL
eukprot:TRINITY_DN29141_c0_g1_i1.p1 TRINITY_DN29141_c0_g1~~TRINITY_DN29141_c0_g1_i1.p1  ORF type:complete len:253 (-),score=35.37 TRINITY_DN29141_c0_g1_i1:54-773(-)